jgi:hypothetical protein
MKILKFIPFLLAFLFIAASCNKQKQIQKNLYKKEGKWNITTYTITEFENNVQVGKESYGNVGYYVFNKNGTGVLTITFDGDVETHPFAWTNTEKEITMLMDGSYTVIYKILNESKKSMELEYTDIYSSGGTNYKGVNVVKLDKQ